MTFTNKLKGYSLEFTTQANKDLKKLEKKDSLKISQKLSALITGSQNLDIKKLEGESIPKYRLRCGDFRIIYEVIEHRIVVVVVEIGHRKNIYRRY